MGLWANYPFALAPGMGLNAFFALTAVLGMNISWQAALKAVLIEGVIFILLTLTKLRETIVNEIPKNLKISINAGIGFFIAFIGLTGAKIIVQDPNTYVPLEPERNNSAPINVGFSLMYVLQALQDKRLNFRGNPYSNGNCHASRDNRSSGDIFLDAPLPSGSLPVRFLNS